MHISLTSELMKYACRELWSSSHEELKWLLFVHTKSRLARSASKIILTGYVSGALPYMVVISSSLQKFYLDAPKGVLKPSYVGT